jgi:hypothetical protein
VELSLVGETDIFAVGDNLIYSEEILIELYWRNLIGNGLPRRIGHLTGVVFLVEPLG